MQPPSEQITELLQSWSHGDQSVIEKLVPLVYDELHRLAKRYMSDQRPGHTLQTTALVNEAYLRLVDSSRRGWEGRTHFFGACAQVGRPLGHSHCAAARLGCRPGETFSFGRCAAATLSTNNTGPTVIEAIRVLVVILLPFNAEL